MRSYVDLLNYPFKVPFMCQSIHECLKPTEKIFAEGYALLPEVCSLAQENPGLFAHNLPYHCTTVSEQVEPGQTVFPEVKHSVQWRAIWWSNFRSILYTQLQNVANHANRVHVNFSESG